MFQSVLNCKPWSHLIHFLRLPQTNATPDPGKSPERTEQLVDSADEPSGFALTSPVSLIRPRCPADSDRSQQSATATVWNPVVAPLLPESDSLQGARLARALPREKKGLLSRPLEPTQMTQGFEGVHEARLQQSCSLEIQCRS